MTVTWADRSGSAAVPAVRAGQASHRRGCLGSVMTWRRAQMVLLSAQGMDVPAIAKVAFTSEDRVRDVIWNFNADGFSSLYPKYKGGHPPKFTLGQRREIKKIAKSKPAEHDLPFSTWSCFQGRDVRDKRILSVFLPGCPSRQPGGQRGEGGWRCAGGRRR
jgi:winged helix-turn helix protein